MADLGWGTGYQFYKMTFHNVEGWINHEKMKEEEVYYSGLEQAQLHPIKLASEFPDLVACYQLTLTLPVASASAERSFPTMRRIKTHLRASM